MGTDQQFCLRWNNFHTSITSAFESLRDDEDFVDITLACDGKQVKAHKMVLSACSPYFRNLLKGNPCQHPIVFLKDVTFANLASILDFMYHGEVNVSHNDLATFLKTAEALKVRGLAEDDKKKDAENYIESSSPGPPRDPPDPGSPKHDETSATDTHLSDSSPPPSKRHRRRSGASVQSAEDTSETVLSDLREASVKNEPQEFNDEDEMLGHSLDGTGDLKNDNVNSDVNDDRNFGHSESVSISRSQAAMQQLQESFGSFLPSMSQSSGFMPHGATDMARSSFPLEAVQGLPPGISTLPGPSMSQSNASQDGSQDVMDWRSPLSWRLEKHPLNQRYDSSCQFSSIIDVDEEVFSKGTNDYSSQRQSFEGGATQGSYLGQRSLLHTACLCPYCHKVISNKYNLKTHIADKHTVQKERFTCELCGRVYSTKHSLATHMSSMHRGDRMPRAQGLVFGVADGLSEMPRTLGESSLAQMVSQIAPAPPLEGGPTYEELQTMADTVIKSFPQ